MSHSLPKTLASCLAAVTLVLAYPLTAWANPSSTNYQLQDYSVGSISGSDQLASPSYGVLAVIGENGAFDSTNQSTNYTFNGGIIFAMQAPTPHQPTLTNPHNFYDRLLATLHSDDDSDTLNYAFAISADDFVTTYFVSSTGTLKDQLSDEDFQSYDHWGADQGFMITGLDSNTEYKIKVKARQGQYTESDYSLEASAETTVPSLSFSIDGSANMGVWSEENNYSSTAVSTLTTSTNAYNGYQVYAYATTPLTRQNGTETIADYVGTYASPGAWLSGLGFGFTTNDTLVNNQLKWNQNPCPADGGPPLCYAAFNHSAPGDVIVDHQEPLNDGPLVDQEFSITYKAVTQASQVAGTYSATIIYTITPIF